jgi:hypothetical protein
MPDRQALHLQALLLLDDGGDLLLRLLALRGALRTLLDLEKNRMKSR